MAALIARKDKHFQCCS